LLPILTLDGSLISLFLRRYLTSIEFKTANLLDKNASLHNEMRKMSAKIGESNKKQLKVFDYEMSDILGPLTVTRVSRHGHSQYTQYNQMN
jgi:hypothetical protein